jgi:DNA-binding NarL/FixJ family response regulator
MSNRKRGDLTPREREIVELVAVGMSNKEIARALGIADGTIKVHLHRVFDKLTVRNRTMLALSQSAQRARSAKDCDQGDQDQDQKEE